MYEPRLITPFLNSGLSQFFKQFIVGDTAFPDIEDAYPWRGSVRKREGTVLFGNIPTYPVQGLKTWVNPSTLSPNLIAFSLTKSYGYSGGTFTDITQLAYASTPFSFGTTQFQYYWTSNFQGSMWTTNGLGYTTAGYGAGTINGILYLTANAINSWNIFTPQINGTPTYLNGALIVLPYKGRLICLNTIEGEDTGANNQSFPNRARWGQLGTDYVPKFNTGSGTNQNTSPPAPFGSDANSWRSDIPGRGGFIDADTSERIISAGIVNDILIVGFQRSTWRLRYTGNEVLPFIWERLNTQYGAESTFSVVPFDKDALFFSRFGWISASTNEVNRIDWSIPDVSFSFETGNATTFANLNTVQGIRDYYREMAYWTFAPIAGVDQQIYAYNYLDKSWAVFNPTNIINCFGEYYNTADKTWSTFSDPTTNKWSDYNSPDDIWKNFGSSQNQGFPLILGGDAATTGATAGNIYQMFEFNASPTTDDGTPFNFYIQTKRFNPYFESGQKCRMGYVDLYVGNEVFGEIQFQHFIDDKSYPVFERNVAIYPRGVILNSSIVTGNTTTITTAQANNLVLGQSVVISNVTGTAANALNNQVAVVASITNTFTFVVNIGTNGLTVTGPGYLWLPEFDPGDTKYVRVFLGGVGYHHQFVITLSNAQLADPIKATAQFELQAMVIWTKPMGRIRG